MDNIAGTTAASLDALCSQYLHYWRQARLSPEASERRLSLAASKPSAHSAHTPDEQADTGISPPSAKQSIKISDLENFIKRIEQQIGAIKALQDQVNA